MLIKVTVLLGLFRDVVATCERPESNDQASRRISGDERSGTRTSIYPVSIFNPVNQPQLTKSSTDYELACCFECDLSMQGLNPNRDMDPPIPLSYDESLKCPLISSPTTFAQIRETLNLSLATAEILDNVRFLTLSITSSDQQPSTSKIQSTASWIHQRLEVIPIPTIPEPSERELILTILRTTALTFTHCISTLSPFTNAYTPSALSSLLSQISSIPLNRWKRIPGIFLWVLLVACPSAGNVDEVQGRWLKKKMAVTGMTIGMSDFGLAIGGLRGFWKVQRWIARERKEWEKGVIDPEILGK
jgi:hypothetical protein